MYNVLLELGPFRVYSYGLMIAIGFLLCIHLVTRDANRQGIDSGTVHEIGFWALLCGVIGARLLHIIMFPQSYSWGNPLGWIALWNGGLVFQGALPAVLVYAVWTMRLRGIEFWKAVDIAFPYIPLGHAFGRVGCFLNGCCYGVPAHGFPLGVAFPRRPFDTAEPPTGSPPYLEHLQEGLITADAAWSVPVHPTQLYSVFALLALFALLWSLRKYWHPFTGFTMPVYMMVYSTYRFFVEFVRGDGNPTGLGGGLLSDQQVFSLLTILAGAVLFAGLAYYQRRMRPQAGAQS